MGHHQNDIVLVLIYFPKWVQLIIYLKNLSKKFDSFFNFYNFYYKLPTWRIVSGGKKMMDPQLYHSQLISLTSLNFQRIICLSISYWFYSIKFWYHFFEKKKKNKDLVCVIIASSSTIHCYLGFFCKLMGSTSAQWGMPILGHVTINYGYWDPNPQPFDTRSEVMDFSESFYHCTTFTCGFQYHLVRHSILSSFSSVEYTMYKLRNQPFAQITMLSYFFVEIFPSRKWLVWEKNKLELFFSLTQSSMTVMTMKVVVVVDIIVKGYFFLEY